MYIHLYLENKPIADIDYLSLGSSYLFLGHVIKDDNRIGSISFRYNQESNFIYIDFVYVASEYKGMGYSRELLKYISKLFNNAKISGTACNDKEALSYWTHMGATFGYCQRCPQSNCIDINSCEYNSNLYFELEI